MFFTDSLELPIRGKKIQEILRFFVVSTKMYREILETRRDLCILYREKQSQVGVWTNW